METMAHSIEVRYMKIDKDLLATYRNLLSATKDTLAQTQYTQLLAQIEISPTKRLENSYRSLFNAIDKYNHGDMDKLVSHRFLFDVLTASPKKRERDLRRITAQFCDFVKSAGSNNTQNHRYIVMRYATLVENSVAELSALDMDKKDNEFHRKWIAELRERLDTKDNK
jgi:Tfp pilus assembly protein PilV|tara:strand:+ start:332 stop:835 length:504 start_codon:yes stop_codon:yes gene_type:complete